MHQSHNRVDDVQPTKVIEGKNEEAHYRSLIGMGEFCAQLSDWHKVKFTLPYLRPKKRQLLC